MADTYINDGEDFSGWTERVDGDGAASLVDGTYNFSASANSPNRAYLMKRYRAFPGDTVHVYIWAQAVSGDPLLAVDWPVLDGDAYNEIQIDSDDWKEYRLTLTIPEGADADDYFSITAGLGYSQAGEVNIRRPRVEFARSRQANDGTIIYKNSDGIAALRPDGTMECWGIKEITPSAADTPTSGAVTFPVPFSSDSDDINVQVSINSTVPGTTVKGWSFSSPSKTGVTLYVTRSNTTATQLRWRATGLWKNTTQSVY